MFWSYSQKIFSCLKHHQVHFVLSKLWLKILLKKSYALSRFKFLIHPNQSIWALKQWTWKKSWKIIPLNHIACRTRSALLIEPLRPERFFIRTFNSTSLYILSVCEVCYSNIHNYFRTKEKFCSSQQPLDIQSITIHFFSQFYYNEWTLGMWVLSMSLLPILQQCNI